MEKYFTGKEYVIPRKDFKELMSLPFLFSNDGKIGEHNGHPVYLID